MAEVMSCSQYGDHLLSNLRRLQEADTLCDLTLIADNTSIRVHRAVMAASSDYFQALLTVDMQERNQKSITLKGVPSKGLLEVVHFAYTGKLRCTLENITEILLAASHLQFSDAMTLCSTFIVGITNMTNSVDMYNIAEQFQLTKVKEKTLTLILNHFDDIAKRDEFLSFDEKFLATMLEDNRLKVFSELRLFELVMRWIKVSTEDRSKYLYYLMSRVRFPLINPTDLVDVIMCEPMMKRDPQCLELILEANKYHMLPSQQPLLQNLRTQVRCDMPSLIMLDVDEEGPKVFDLATHSWGSLQFNNIETFHAQVCSMQNYMYVCGGIELYSSNNPVSARSYRYDPRFDTWKDICPMSEPRHRFTLVSDGSSLFAIGGYCNGQYKNVVEQYILCENRWMQRASVDIRLSAAAAAAIPGGFIYLSGGQTDRGISRLVFRYQVNNDTWNSCSPMLHPRMDHAMCSYKNKLYVMGGYDKNIVKAYDINRVECYDIEVDQWNVVFENSPKISGMYTCLVGPVAYMAGGFTYDENKKRSEVWCYDFETNKWHVIARLLIPAMSLPCCALFLPRHMLRDVTV